MNRTPYVYELVDTETGKYYIGSNYSKGCCPEWLGVKYFTSSKVIDPLFRNNPNRFAKKILLIGSVEYVVEMEAALLKKIDAKNDPLSYNGHNGNGEMNCAKFGVTGGKIGGSVRAESGDLQKMASLAGKASLKARNERNISAFYKTKEQSKEHGFKILQSGAGIFSMNAEERRNAAVKGGITSSQVMWKCSQCGYISNAMVMGNHHKFNRHTGKERV